MHEIDMFCWFFFSFFEIWVVLPQTCLVLAHWNYGPDLVTFLSLCPSFLAIASNRTWTIATKSWSIFQWSPAQGLVISLGGMARFSELSEHFHFMNPELMQECGLQVTLLINFALFLNMSYEENCMYFLYLMKNSVGFFLIGYLL